MAKSTKVEQEVSVLVPTEADHSELSVIMEGEAKKRALITQYITHHMKNGNDYGTIKMGNRETKPSLFKPGSEKFLSLFKLVARFERDSDTWEMAGSEAGVFAYRCLLTASNGQIVGEGRGVSKLSEKPGWTINNAVKIAEKRAQIDAVLRTGALSDFFTQDLEDMVQPADTSAPKEDRGATQVYQQKQRIKELCDAIVLMPLDTKEEYENYVKQMTGLDLIEGNFLAIIKKLEEQQ